MKENKYRLPHANRLLYQLNHSKSKSRPCRTFSAPPSWIGIGTGVGVGVGATPIFTVLVGTPFGAARTTVIAGGTAVPAPFARALLERTAWTMETMVRVRTTAMTKPMMARVWISRSQ